MIYTLEGIVKVKTDKFVVIDVGGVGYRVFCAGSVLEDIKERAKLYTHQYIRENIMDLYGFLSQEDLEFFELLISISGIGPKAALSVMALAPVDTLKQAIASGQKSLLTKVSGIGQRTAERIVLELKDKIDGSVAGIKKLTADSDAIDALEGLGYTRNQAQKALSEIPEKIQGIEDRVKEALKLLGK